MAVFVDRSRRATVTPTADIITCLAVDQRHGVAGKHALDLHCRSFACRAGGRNALLVEGGRKQPATGSHFGMSAATKSTPASSRPNRKCASRYRRSSLAMTSLAPCTRQAFTASASCWRSFRLPLSISVNSLNSFRRPPFRKPAGDALTGLCGLLGFHLQEGTTLEEAIRVSSRQKSGSQALSQSANSAQYPELECQSLVSPSRSSMVFWRLGCGPG
jgi:hypothetical protein